MPNIQEINRKFVRLYETTKKGKKYVGFCYDYILHIDKKTFENFSKDPCNVLYRDNKYTMRLKKQINEDIYEVSLSQVGYTKYLK